MSLSGKEYSDANWELAMACHVGHVLADRSRPRRAASEGLTLGLPCGQTTRSVIAGADETRE